MKFAALTFVILLSVACNASPFEPTLIAATPAAIAETPVAAPVVEVVPVVEAPPAAAPAPPKPSPAPPKAAPVVQAPVHCQVSAWVLASVSAWSECKVWRLEERSPQRFRSETYTRTITVQPSNGGNACPTLTLIQVPYYDCTP